MKTEQLNEQELEINVLDNQLLGWTDIWNALRENPNFKHQADFLWDSAIYPIYSEMPKNSVLAVEITETMAAKLKETNLKRVRQRTEDDGIHFYFYVNPPVDTDTAGEGRIEIYAHTVPYQPHEYGIIEDGYINRPYVLTQRDILGFRAKTKIPQFDS